MQPVENSSCGGLGQETGIDTGEYIDDLATCRGNFEFCKRQADVIADRLHPLFQFLMIPGYKYCHKNVLTCERKTKEYRDEAEALRKKVTEKITKTTPSGTGQSGSTVPPIVIEIRGKDVCYGYYDSCSTLPSGNELCTKHWGELVCR